MTPSWNFFNLHKERIAHALPLAAIELLASAMNLSIADTNLLIHTERFTEQREEFMHRALIIIYAIGTDDPLISEYAQLLNLRIKAHLIKQNP